MVKVEFSIDPNLLLGRGNASPEEAKALLEKEITNKLRCFLSFQGVSGLGYLNLDYLDGSNADETVVLAHGDKLVIPSAKGAVLSLGESLSTILESLSKVDFEKLDQTLNSTLKSVNALSDTIGTDLAAISGAMTATLSSLNNTSSEVANLANALSKDIGALDLDKKSGELSAALRRLGAVLSQAESLTRTTKNSLPATMENLRVMSENLREFSEMAKRYPSQILFGAPPSEVKR
jgi:ABC-type transporter Mla subunit MlaD